MKIIYHLTLFSKINICIEKIYSLSVYFRLGKRQIKGIIFNMTDIKQKLSTEL